MWSQPIFLGGGKGRRESFLVPKKMEETVCPLAWSELKYCPEERTEKVQEANGSFSEGRKVQSSPCATALLQGWRGATEEQAGWGTGKGEQGTEERRARRPKAPQVSWGVAVPEEPFQPSQSGAPNIH